jgi:predicted metal-dependent hydrolase
VALAVESGALDGAIADVLGIDVELVRARHSRIVGVGHVRRRNLRIVEAAAASGHEAAACALAALHGLGPQKLGPLL